MNIPCRFLGRPAAWRWVLGVLAGGGVAARAVAFGALSEVRWTIDIDYVNTLLQLELAEFMRQGRLAPHVRAIFGCEFAEDEQGRLQVGQARVPGHGHLAAKMRARLVARSQQSPSAV